MRLAAISICGLAACAPAPEVRELSNASVNNLMAQPLPQVLASIDLAEALAVRCLSVDFDARAAAAIAQAKTGGNAQLAQQSLAATEIERELVRRSFEARREGLDVCTALTEEIEDQTALSAVLVAR